MGRTVHFERHARGCPREDAFRFLLTREPKENSRVSFDRGDISMHFPEFEKEI